MTALQWGGRFRTAADPRLIAFGSSLEEDLVLAPFDIACSLAHVEALKVFPTARHALLSQLPMLLLMVFLTTAGLWILSLPIDAGQLASPL